MDSKVYRLRPASSGCKKVVRGIAAMANAQRTHENNQSSLFEKVPPDLLRAVNIAIIERRPPTFRAVWMQFELANFGVSYTAFYRYARRLRDRVNLAEAAGLSAEDDPGVDAAIQKLADRRLLELLLNADSAELNPEIVALLSAHHRGTHLDLHRRRFDEHSRLAQARLDHDRDHLRFKSQLLHSARDGVLSLVNEARMRRSSPENLVNLVNPVPSPSQLSNPATPLAPNPVNPVPSPEKENAR